MVKYSKRTENGVYARMDTFFEQIVKKKKTPAEWAIIIGTIVVAAVLLLAILNIPNLMVIPILPTLIMVGIGYGGWWLITSQNNEFEYCVTNGDIDIDLITAKRKRKRIVSVVGRKVESLLPYDAAKVNEKTYQRVVIAAPSKKEAVLWCFTYHSKKNGHTLVVFQPDQRVLRALFDGLQSLVKIETRRAMQEKGILFE